MSDSLSPFKLLDAYTKEDIDRFFGRKREVAQLYNAVFSSRITLLYGASGTGKTSLVQCGLQNKFYDSDWYPFFIRREQNINHSLQQALVGALKDSSEENESISRLVDGVYKQAFRPVYLIFDQFEELFIEGSSEEQKIFYSTISDLIERDQRAKVILIMREEWLGHLSGFERVIPRLFDNRLRLERFSDKLSKQVVWLMLKRADIVCDDLEAIEGIVGRLKNSEGYIDLTDLQIYLDRLYRKAEKMEGQPVVFDLALVEKAGEIENVLSLFLDEQIQELKSELEEKYSLPKASEIPLDILFALVTNDRTKRSQSLKEIFEQLPTREDIKEEVVKFCLDRLVEMRLINRIN
jgi:hypothetical protein